MLLQHRLSVLVKPQPRLVSGAAAAAVATAVRHFSGGAAAAAAGAANALSRAYALLGVSPTASDADLKAAFVEQAKRHHPDSQRQTSASAAKFIEARDCYTLIMQHRRQGGDSDAAAAAVEEALGHFDIRHTAPQHRQYLEYDGLGSGTPIERLRQRDQWRVHQAAEAVHDYRVAQLQPEAETGSEVRPLRTLERRSARDFRTRSLMDRLVEDLIQESVNRGELQSCRYYGKPLPDRSQGAAVDPFADSMTHQLNSILANNGYEPDWLLLDKEIRAGAACLRARLVDTRRRLGPWPFNEADAAAWQRTLADSNQTLADLNGRIDRLNLCVPTLRQQRCHYRLTRLASPIAEDNCLANTWRLVPDQSKEFQSDDSMLGSGGVELFSLATLRQVWADLREVLSRRSS